MGFFPPDYKKASGAEETSSGPNPKYFEFSKKYLGPGETASFRICGDFDSGHVVCGFQYFTNEGRIRRFPNYPENYQSDIGLTYQAKKDGTEEKDKPKYFLSFTAFSPEKDDFICVTVLQKGLRVMDSTAVSLCMDNGLPILVFRLEPGACAEVVCGGGRSTLVGPEE